MKKKPRSSSPTVISDAEARSLASGTSPIERMLSDAMQRADSTGKPSELPSADMKARTVSDAYRALESQINQQKGQMTGTATRLSEREARRAPWLERSKQLRAAGLRSRKTRAQRIHRQLVAVDATEDTERAVYDYLAKHGE